MLNVVSGHPSSSFRPSSSSFRPSASYHPSSSAFLTTLCVSVDVQVHGEFLSSLSTIVKTRKVPKQHVTKLTDFPRRVDFSSEVELLSVLPKVLWSLSTAFKGCPAQTETVPCHLQNA